MNRPRVERGEEEEEDKVFEDFMKLVFSRNLISRNGPCETHPSLLFQQQWNLCFYRLFFLHVFPP